MSETQKSGCLGVLLGLFGSPLRPSAVPGAQALVFPYGLRDEFLSAAELSFFRVLKEALGSERHIVTKVRLSDLFFVKRPHENQAARNRIDRKHVDFVVCDATTMNPLLGVELDDKSHQRKKAIESDALKNEVFEKAGLPLLRVRAQRGYVVKELRQVVEQRICGNVPPPPLPASYLCDALEDLTTTKES